MSRDLRAALLARRDALFSGVAASSAETEIMQRLYAPGYWQPFTDVLVRWLQRVAAIGVADGGLFVDRLLGVKAATIEIDWTLANDPAAEWAIRHGHEVVGDMAKRTNARIQKEISNWIVNKEPFKQLVRRVQLDPLLYSAERARRIAVTEVTRAYAEGNREAWRQSRIITSMVWQTAGDEKVCPVCGGLQGQVVSIEEQFIHPGGEGLRARYEGGRYFPPAHTLCRCIIAPRVDILYG